VAQLCSCHPFAQAELERGQCKSQSETMLLFPLLNQLTFQASSPTVTVAHQHPNAPQQLPHRRPDWHPGPARNWDTSHPAVSFCGIAPAGRSPLAAGQAACAPHGTLPSAWKTLTPSHVFLFILLCLG